jgi:undecaprenyl-diphosphatase
LSELIKAIVLGIVQGITEFLPISSDGHLVIVPSLFGWESPSLLFITMLHWGTLVAIGLVFWQDFVRILAAFPRAVRSGSWDDLYARLGLLIILGTLPVVVGGLLLKDWVEGLLASTAATGFFLVLTGVLLASSEWLSNNWKTPRILSELRWLDSVLMGAAQIIALLPGVSRSGSTIAVGLLRGVNRADAAYFSFLLGAPAIFGAGLLATVEALANGGGEFTGNALPLMVGIVVSAVTGLLAIRFLLAYLRNHGLYVFAIYCVVVGFLVMLEPYLFG